MVFKVVIELVNDTGIRLIYTQWLNSTFFFNLEIMTRIIKWNETLCMWMDIIKSIQCIPPSPIYIYDGATHVSMDSRWKCIYHFLQSFSHLSVLILSSAYHCLPSFTHISDMKMTMGPFWCVSDFIHTYNTLNYTWKSWWCPYLTFTFYPNHIL